MEQFAQAGATIIALVTAITGLAVHFRLRTRKQRQEAVGQAFADAVKGLGAQPLVERVASAALLRRFFDKSSEFGLRGQPYAPHAVRVISAVLRSEPTGVIQKLLADGLRDGPLANADLQKANLRGCYWGSDEFEDPVDASGADFYGADVSGASLRRTVVVSATFKDAVLIGTVLKGANAAKANFEGADLRGASFDGAVLTNAKFAGATGIPAVIADRLVDGVYPLAERLPVGYARESDQGDDGVVRVFVSAPSHVDAGDDIALQQVLIGLTEAGASISRLLPDDYTPSTPLINVTQRIRASTGVVIFGPPQFTADSVEVDDAGPRTVTLSTPWNHLEAGIAYALDKPLLVLHHGAGGGVFDVPEHHTVLTTVDAKGPTALLDVRERSRKWAESLRP